MCFYTKVIDTHFISLDSLQCTFARFSLLKQIAYTCIATQCFLLWNIFDWMFFKQKCLPCLYVFSTVSLTLTAYLDMFVFFFILLDWNLFHRILLHYSHTFYAFNIYQFPLCLSPIHCTHHLHFYLWCTFAIAVESALHLECWQRKDKVYGCQLKK